ncbi:UNVERIFIED_CONTAM: hypothetical protein FKN15_042062 [Acipenser sinensis]
MEWGFSKHTESLVYWTLLSLDKWEEEVEGEFGIDGGWGFITSLRSCRDVNEGD